MEIKTPLNLDAQKRVFVGHKQASLVRLFPLRRSGRRSATSIWPQHRSTHPGSQPVNGFGLVEVLITVVIMGILASIALPNFGQQVAKTHDKTAKSRIEIEAGLCEESLLFGESHQLSSGFTGSCSPSSSFQLTSESGNIFKVSIDADSNLTKEY